MKASILNVFCMFAGSMPFLSIGAILFHYHWRRAAWRRRWRRGRMHPGFCPSSSSLGAAFQFMSAFYRPTVAYVIEATQDEDADDDDEGDAETPAKHLNRQLKRIRRGERVERLVYRL